MKLFVVSHGGWGTQIDVVTADDAEEAMTLAGIGETDDYMRERAEVIEIDAAVKGVHYTYENSLDSRPDRD